MLTFSLTISLTITPAIVMSPCIIIWGLYCVYHHYCSFAAFRLLQAQLVNEGMEAGHMSTMLCERPAASWRGAWAGFTTFVSPRYMHHCDLRSIRDIKASMKRGVNDGVVGRPENCASRYFRADELIEPFHPYWQLPEEHPSSVSGIEKPYGLVLGKSNWQYRKRILVRRLGGKGEDQRGPDGIRVQVRNHVVLWRDAGAVHLNRRTGGLLEQGSGASRPDDPVEPEEEGCATVYVPRSRLEALEAQLRNVFGDDLLAVIPVYDSRPVAKLLHKLDETIGAIHKLEHSLGGKVGKGGLDSGKCDLEGGLKAGDGGVSIEFGEGRAGKTATRPFNSKKGKKLRAMLDRKRDEKLALEMDIAAARAHALENPVDVGGFAVFSSHQVARLAASGDIGLVPAIDMESSWAPPPDSINFYALPGSMSYQRKALVWAMPFLIALMLFPIGALTGALANLTVALCGGTPETNPIYWQGYCDSSSAQVLGFLLTTIVPVSISAFWDTFVMPLCCQQLTQRLRMASSLAELDIAITIQLYVYTVFNTFFLGVIGGAAVTDIGTAIENGRFAELIGESLPSASNFFLNYVAVHALFTNLFRYFWPHDGTVLFQVLRLFRLASQPLSERERWIVRSTPSFRSARHYASFLLIFVIATAYANIAPFSLPLALGFFVTSWMAWKYNSIHFYQPNYESSGDVWLIVYRCYVATLGVAIIFHTCVIVSKKFFWQASIMAAVDIVVLHLGLVYIQRNVAKYVDAFPLQRVPPVKIVEPSCVEEIRQLYTPSQLRAGAVGWHPEEGKVWEKYGLPF